MLLLYNFRSELRFYFEYNINKILPTVSTYFAFYNYCMYSFAYLGFVIKILRRCANSANRFEVMETKEICDQIKD